MALFVPAALLFLDVGWPLPAVVARVVAGLQLVPALLRLPAAGAAVVLAALALVTLLTGRVYCSTVCPLGTLQDALVRIGDRRDRRGRFRFRASQPRAAWHLGVAAAAGVLAAGGSLLALELLEPWSGFGRIVSALVRPGAAAAVNGASRALAEHHVYAVAPVVHPPAAWGAAAVALAWLAGIAALALARGRLFCNLLCPAGAVLRLLSRWSAIRIVLDPAICNACGVCEKACKAGAIDAARRTVDFTSCVACFDCLDVCPRDGVRLAPAWRRVLPAGAAPALTPDPGRRALLRAAVLAPAALLAPPARAADPRDGRAPVMPPGAGDRRRFTSRCTACQLCVAECPTQVLRPALLAYGGTGLLQPRLVYDDASCVYDCNRCGQVCPTGAIAELPLAEKHLAQVGRACFVRSDCVVEVKKTICGACAEHCPTTAIAMVPVPGEVHLRIPRVNEERCIGCGACEHPCPVRPRKAIYVEARPSQGRARPPQAAPLAVPTQDGEFPF
jgi:ferredoxin